MFLCIDIGGTKTLAALVNNHGTIIDSFRLPSGPDQTAFFNQLISKIRTNFPLTDLAAISVALPGPTENNQILWYANLPWTDLDTVSKLRPLSPAPIFIANDADLAALAEAQQFSGTSLYLTFSTGIGGALIKNGKIHPDYPSYEPGHQKYLFNNQLTEWEDFAAASAIVSHFGKLTTDITANSDWNEIATRIAIGLAPNIATLHPDRIIFGGPLGLALASYRKPLTDRLTQALPDTPIPDFLTAKHKHESVIHGCYLYAKLQLATK